jgi:hypothetical protein
MSSAITTTAIGDDIRGVSRPVHPTWIDVSSSHLSRRIHGPVMSILDLAPSIVTSPDEKTSSASLMVGQNHEIEIVLILGWCWVNERSRRVDL